MFAAFFLSSLTLGSALPWNEIESSDVRQSRLVSGQIENAINDVSKQIKEAGLDPFHLEKIESAYALPVPILLDVSAHLTDLMVTGLSNIVIHNVNYAVITSRLNLNISLPRIECNLHDSGIDMTVLGKRFHGSSHFKFAIVNVFITGRIQVNVGLITGVSIRSSNLSFSLGGIEWKGVLKILGQDLSHHVEKFFTESLYNQINAVNREINQLINLVVVEVGNNVLN